jgi:ATP-dependent exoDNAse (exonuclease V) beta subunit
MINAIDTWEQVLEDKEVTVGQLGDLYQFLGKDSVKRGFISRVQADPNKAQKVDKQGMIDNYGLIPDCLNKEWQEVFNRSIDVERRAFIEKAITNKEDLHGEPRIAISTIHQAKGGEADNVAVLLDLSPSQKKYSMLKPDGLHRQFYVAVTRALERLYLVKARNDYYRYII